MKFFIIIFLLSFSFTSSFAQNKGYWNVFLNNRKLLTGVDSIFSEKKYILDINRNSLDSSGSLVVECIGMDYKNGGWTDIRTIQIAVKKYYTLYSKDSTNRLEIDNAFLKNWFKRGKKLYIYTWLYPPEGANIKVKIRKIHLCTLRLR